MARRWHQRLSTFLASLAHARSFRRGTAGHSRMAWWRATCSCPPRRFVGKAQGNTTNQMVSAWPLLARSSLQRRSRGMVGYRSIEEQFTPQQLLAEGEAEIAQLHQQGFSAVDMETATTFAVAEYFGMLRAAILYVFDNPRQREHLLLSDAEKDVRRQQANRTVRELTFALALELDQGLREGRLAI